MAATTMTDELLLFLSNQKPSSTVGRLAHCTFMLAIWEIRCSRNRARFQQQIMTAQHIVNRSGAGGGGILHDHKGICVLAFAKNYQGVISALVAEALALRNGLTNCCSKGFLDIMVETDSLNLAADCHWTDSSPMGIVMYYPRCGCNYSKAKGADQACAP
ncbi:hypothetical protein Taro_005070 [Colocasia esculenta]|uniref:RNase H type-1 domain-containing protein n=1 Tax=Colocasia esculenta TaxID=4460 RepID=A0A843TTF5_COLES|nr:hypothetical protein [Colocasia esculenta]